MYKRQELSQPCHGDGGEADAACHAVIKRVVCTGDNDEADKAGDGAGQEHRAPVSYTHLLAADGAVLKNIRVSGTAKANGSAAGIAAQAKNTQFLGCVNEAAVTSTGEKAGGIAALLDGASSLTGCTNLGACLLYTSCRFE